MRIRLLLALCLAASAACAPSAPAPEAEPDVESAGLAEEAIEGRWRIVSIDGRPVASLPEHGPGERSPHLIFGPGTYGGNTGCNGFGGLGVLHGDRFYAGPAMQSAMGCGDLTAQEEAIIRLIAESPRLSLAADGRLTLTDGRRSMLLARLPEAAPAEPWTGPLVLAGTSWGLSAIDGQSRLGAEQRTLSFEAERWSLTGPCGRSAGSWRQRGNSIVARAEIRASACSASVAEAEEALFDLLESRPRFATGPNGEFLIGGGGHWAVGDRPRQGLGDDSARLQGAWQIVAINGSPPLGGRGVQLNFGATGYSGSAGCNSLQGYYLAHARRFHSAPPMQTEMACGGGLGEQEETVGRILTSSPALALGDQDILDLVGERGRLRLRRSGDSPWAPEGRSWNGEALDVELTMLGGRPLQGHYSEPVTHLRLSERRFDISSGCGRFGGVWRRGEGQFEFFTDAAPEPSGNCAGALASRLREFMRQFNGPARIQIGASGEFLMASERVWLAGRVLRPSRGK